MLVQTILKKKADMNILYIFTSVTKKNILIKFFKCC